MSDLTNIMSGRELCYIQVCHSNQFLHVESASVGENAVIRQSRLTGNLNAFQFYLKPHPEVPNGFLIQNVHSGKYWKTENNSPQSSSCVNQGSNEELINYIWALEPTQLEGQTVYYIRTFFRSPHDEVHHYLQIESGTQTENARLWVWTQVDRADFKFRILPTEPKPSA